MIQRNPVFSRLAAGYLFPEIGKRRREFAVSHPGADIISLGIGNTTEPLTPHITAAMEAESHRLGTKEGYTGYGEDLGMTSLREKIASVLYKGIVSADEVFISDGAKCDIGRLQLLFGSSAHVAVQDPAYPVYVDGSILIGAAGKQGNRGYADITYMPCTAENNFFPDLDAVPENSLIYFCSPNNPTGAAATRQELETLVSFARKNGCIIIFDAAYSAFIRNPELPVSIFGIEGSRECAIEVNSFSKPAGFTGVRLGWSIVPRELRYSDGSPVSADWSRITTTVFNGASNVAQYGGLAALEPEGLAEMRGVTDFYLENARIIRAALGSPNFREAGAEVYGGDNAPYVWARFPGMKSWQVFDFILEMAYVVTTPGAGFGPAGESFVRFSSFGHREDIERACVRLSGLKFKK